MDPYIGTFGNVSLQPVIFFLGQIVLAAVLTTALATDIKKRLHGNTVGLIGNLKEQQYPARIEFPRIDFNDFSLEYDIISFFRQYIVDRGYVTAETFPQPYPAVAAAIAAAGRRCAPRFFRSFFRGFAGFLIVILEPQR